MAIVVRLASLILVMVALGTALHMLPARKPLAEVRLARPGDSRDLLEPLDQAAEAPPARATQLLPACTSDTSKSSSCRVVEVDDDRRRALVLGAGKKVEIPLDVAGASALRFSAATRGRENQLDVRVTLAEGADIETWEHRLHTRDGWVDASLPIPASTGKATLSIESMAPSKQDENGMLALAVPRLIRPADRVKGSGPRNIVLYLIDTLRPDHTSTYGYERRTTPRLDELARDGVVFERAYSTAARTRPATASLLTSLYPLQHHARLGRGLSLDTETLAERLREAGWSTWAFVANGHVFGRSLNFEQGFDRFQAVRGVKLNNHARSEEINQVMLPHLRAHADEPFFLYVHAVDPHSPYEPPPGYAGTFVDPSYDGAVVPEETRSRILEARELSEADLARVRDLYDEDILYQDAMLGALIDELAQLGLKDDTIVVVVADHGEEFLEHGGFEHGDRLFEEQIRVPMVIRVPGRPELAGRRVDDAVSLVDVMPTLLGWYGLPVPPGTQGEDLTARIGGARGEARVIYTEESTPKRNGDLRALVDGSWKLIRRGDPGPDEASEASYQLFDLEGDPTEQSDRAASDPSRLTEMRARLDARHAELSAKPAQGEAPAEELDARTRQQLEALGYIMETPPATH